MTNVRKYLLDLLERIAKTFLQVFLGQVFVSGTGIGPDKVVAAIRDWDSVERAFVSGVAAVAALLIGLLLGWANSGAASAVPKRLLPGEGGQVHIFVAIIVILVVVVIFFGR